MLGSARTPVLLCGTALVWLALPACEGETNDPSTTVSETRASETRASESATGTAEPELADVTAVEVSGAAGSYTFAVTVQSPDTGCDQYANWWEVLDENGALIYRRILGHSHVGEQPFTRSGGPVDVDADTPVFVRAHLFPDGYGGATWMGSATEGFAVADDLPEGFGDGVPDETPACAH